MGSLDENGEPILSPMAKKKRKKRSLTKVLTKDWLPDLPAHLVESFEAMSKIENFEGHRRYGFVIFKNFFTEEELRISQNLHQYDGAFDPKDRDSALEYGHNVWRVEYPMCQQFKGFYDKFVAVALWTDKEYFGKIEAAGYEFFY